MKALNTSYFDKLKDQKLKDHIEKYFSSVIFKFQKYQANLTKNNEKLK